MNLNNYTEDRICREMGLPGFTSDPLIENSFLAVRLLLKPSFHPELGISVIISGPEALLQTAALGEQLWTLPSAAWHPSFAIETQEFSRNEGERMVSATESAFLSLGGSGKSRGMTLIDGMPFVLAFIKKGWPALFQGNACAPQFGEIIKPYLQLAWEHANDEICKRAIHSASRYVGLNLPPLEANHHTPATRLLFLGNQQETQQVINAVRAMQTKKTPDN